MSSLLRNLFGRGAPPAPRMSVLFVCMGNICRSPTAEAVFRRQVQVAGLESEFGCDSAGTTDAHAGDAPDGRAQATARKRGYEMDRLRARQVNVDDFARFDLVLAMDRHNLTILEALCPEGSAHKVRLLMEYARRHDAREVPDPYYGSARGFEAVLDMIEDACEGLIAQLREASAKPPEEPPASPG